MLQHRSELFTQHIITVYKNLKEFIKDKYSLMRMEHSRYMLQYNICLPFIIIILLLFALQNYILTFTVDCVCRELLDSKATKEQRCDLHEFCWGLVCFVEHVKILIDNVLFGRRVFFSLG